jgi:hypothetical protein
VGESLIESSGSNLFQQVPDMYLIIIDWKAEKHTILANTTRTMMTAMTIVVIFMSFIHPG